MQLAAACLMEDFVLLKEANCSNLQCSELFRGMELSIPLSTVERLAAGVADLFKEAKISSLLCNDPLRVMFFVFSADNSSLFCRLVVWPLPFPFFLEDPLAPSKEERLFWLLFLCPAELEGRCNDSDNRLLLEASIKLVMEAFSSSSLWQEELLPPVPR